MEKTIIDKIVSGEIHTIDLIERLRTYERKTIEEFIVELDLESVTRNDGTIEGKRTADYLQNVINTISRELKVPDQWAIYERGNDQAAQEPEQAAPQFPPELDNDKAKKLLQMAIDRNIIDKSYKPANGSTHETIAYLSATLSRLLELNKTKMRNGQCRVLWKPFKSLFGIEYLAQTYSRIIDNEDGTLIKFPPNYNKIDEIYYMVMTRK